MHSALPCVARRQRRCGACPTFAHRLIHRRCNEARKPRHAQDWVPCTVEAACPPHAARVLSALRGAPSHWHTRFFLACRFAGQSAARRAARRFAATLQCFSPKLSTESGDSCQKLRYNKGLALHLHVSPAPRHAACSAGLCTARGARFAVCPLRAPCVLSALRGAPSHWHTRFFPACRFAGQSAARRAARRFAATLQCFSTKLSTESGDSCQKLRHNKDVAPSFTTAKGAP